VDLWHREITVQGKGRRTRIIKIGFGAARSLDRYLRVRARHAQAWRWQLRLGAGQPGPMTASGIYQVTVRRGRQCGIEVFPHRFRHLISHTWLDHASAAGDLMELNGWTSPGCSAATAPAPAAREPAAATTASWRAGRDTSHHRPKGRTAARTTTSVPQAQITVR
jgi:integrase